MLKCYCRLASRLVQIRISDALAVTIIIHYTATSATMKVFIITLLATIAAVQASPLNASCTVTSYSGVAAALKSCTTLVLKDITVPASTTLELTLKNGASLTFAGTIRWAYAQWAGPLIEIKGNKVTVNGAGATLDGQGAKWWDGKGDKGVKKPKFLRIKTTGGSTIKNIKLLNCPKQCVSINSASNTVLDHFVVDVSAGDANGKGHNTDGFDVSSSTGITVQNSVVKNQDDCVAVNQGSNFIFRNLTCSGGHGLSLSVGQSSASGSANTVKNVTFSDCTVLNSDNGIHVKTHSDAGTGSVSDVTYKNINLSGIRKYGINVQEDYEKGHPTGKPKANIPVSKLTMSNVKGSMSGGMGVYILCASGGCSNWSWSGVAISHGKKGNSCNFHPSGFSC
ncbi:unnamed protein product [Ceutorhynchus assimilis]|uniref:endo-polygalacturonase n=1 Tax=Ceutorhynchus assimilis TaxID=467358 RepID=A0A9N9QNR0_9CUCU|nr:unnamed protein product [Ceutorhynchus assimilis]